MYIKGLELSEEDRGELVGIVKKGWGWRMPERLQTLLYLMRAAKRRLSSRSKNCIWLRCMTAQILAG
jgi:hypothetical protein